VKTKIISRISIKEWVCLCVRTCLENIKFPQKCQSLSRSEIIQKGNLIQTSLYLQVGLILWIRRPFPERNFNITTDRNYFSLNFRYEVCVKILSLKCVPKTDLEIYSFLKSFSQTFLRKYTLYFLILFSQLYHLLPFWSDV